MTKKLIGKITKLIGNLTNRLDANPILLSEGPICNISHETNEWNKQALEYAWRPSNGIVPFTKEFSPEEMRKIQEETYEYNCQVLDYTTR